jgi:hypothetical protein
MAFVANGDRPEAPPSAEGPKVEASPTITPENTASPAPTTAPTAPKPKQQRILRHHVYGSARIAAKKSERLVPFKEDRNGRPLSACTEANIKIITDALRIGQSRHKACALAGIPYATTFLYWMKTSGEPYISVQMAVKKAEAEFERRNVLILGVKAEKQPQFAAWLLAHAPSTKKSWREYQQALIDAQGSTFNVAAILDQVQKRRELRAAQSDPTAPINQNPTIIEHDPGDE